MNIAEAIILAVVEGLTEFLPVSSTGHMIITEKLLGVEANDQPALLKKLADKVLNYRLFNDENGKMNLNVQQAAGSLLVVSQFTLAADTQSGLRPSFTPAASPDKALDYYQQFVQQCQALGLNVATGRFASDMQVSLLNDGPVTFLLHS